MQSRRHTEAVRRRRDAGRHRGSSEPPSPDASRRPSQVNRSTVHPSATRRFWRVRSRWKASGEEWCSNPSTSMASLSSASAASTRAMKRPACQTSCCSSMSGRSWRRARSASRFSSWLSSGRPVSRRSSSSSRITPVPFRPFRPERVAEPLHVDDPEDAGADPPTERIADRCHRQHQPEVDDRAGGVGDGHPRALDRRAPGADLGCGGRSPADEGAVGQADGRRRRRSPPGGSAPRARRPIGATRSPPLDSWAAINDWCQVSGAPAILRRRLAGRRAGVAPRPSAAFDLVPGPRWPARW